MLSEARIKELVRNAMEGGMNCPDVSLSECIEFAVRTAATEAARPEEQPFLEALKFVREVIRNSPIEHQVVQMEGMVGLGQWIDERLPQHGDPK